MKWYHWTLIAVAACLVSFGAGRYSKPAKIETREHETIKTVTDTHAVEQVAQLTAQIAELKAHTHVDRVVVTRPGGVRIVHVVTDRQVDRTEAAHTETQAATVVATHAETVHEVTRTQVVTRDAPWSVGAIVLFSPGSFRLSDPAAALDAGVTVSRQLWGPLYVGASATVPVLKPISWPTFAIELGVSF